MVKINSVEAFIFELPLIKSYKTSFAHIKSKKSIIVRLGSGELEGYGEGSTLPFPFYVPDFTESAFLVLKNFIAPLVVGSYFENPFQLNKILEQIRGHSFSKCAVETAFWDLYSQTLGVPLWKLLGGENDKIPVGGAIGIIEDLDKFREEINLNILQKVPRLKIKIQPGWDIEPLTIARKLSKDIPILADANSSYRIEDIDALRQLDKFNLMMLEQPLEWDDIIDHAELQNKLRTPICLDESIFSSRDARKAISINACKIINIKPGRVGGLVESKKIHDYCIEHNVPVWCGGMMESSIGRFFNLSIATLPGFTLPADMSPSKDYFADDIVKNPYDLVDNTAQVPNFLSDFEVCKHKLDHYTVDYFSIKK